VDAKGEQPVIALVPGPIETTEVPIRTSLVGEYYIGHKHDLDLIEVGPYDDFKVDDPVMVRDDSENKWVRRHFAGVAPDGKPVAWNVGATSWTTESRTSWSFCRRPTPEELGHE
jgi:hypothetical protein